MPRDLRDPEQLGHGLLTRARNTGTPAHMEYDWNREMYESVVLVAEADGRYVGPVEKYGDPRLLPPAWGGIVG